MVWIDYQQHGAFLSRVYPTAPFRKNAQFENTIDVVVISAPFPSSGNNHINASCVVRSILGTPPILSWHVESHAALDLFCYLGRTVCHRIVSLPAKMRKGDKRVLPFLAPSENVETLVKDGLVYLLSALMQGMITLDRVFENVETLVKDGLVYLVSALLQEMIALDRVFLRFFVVPPP